MKRYRWILTIVGAFVIAGCASLYRGQMAYPYIKKPLAEPLAIKYISPLDHADFSVVTQYMMPTSSYSTSEVARIYGDFDALFEVQVRKYFSDAGYDPKSISVSKLSSFDPDINFYAEKYKEYWLSNAEGFGDTLFFVFYKPSIDCTSMPCYPTTNFFSGLLAVTASNGTKSIMWSDTGFKDPVEYANGKLNISFRDGDWASLPSINQDLKKYGLIKQQ